MSKYYMLDCWGPGNDEPTQKPTRADLDEYDIDNRVSWFRGTPILVDLPNPIVMQWKPELSGGGVAWQLFGVKSEGVRNEQGIRRQWAYPANTPPLFHKDLVTVLTKCGVDNFDAYETKIVDTETGVECTDYYAINIIGLVSAVDMDKSVAVVHSDDGLIDTDFDSVVLDESRIQGQYLFRLAESVNAILVHESIKECLESNGNFELTFTEPEKWVG